MFNAFFCHILYAKSYSINLFKKKLLRKFIYTLVSIYYFLLPFNLSSSLIQNAIHINFCNTHNIHGTAVDHHSFHYISFLKSLYY